MLLRSLLIELRILIDSKDGTGIFGITRIVRTGVAILVRIDPKGGVVSIVGADGTIL